HDAASDLFRRAPGDVSLRHDAAAVSPFVHDRHASDLPILHRSAAVLDVCIRGHCHDGRRHAVSGRQFEWIAALGHCTAGDVAIGDDTDGFTAVTRPDDWNLTAVVIDHHPGHFAKRGFGLTAHEVVGHDLANLHEVLLEERSPLQDHSRSRGE